METRPPAFGEKGSDDATPARSGQIARLIWTAPLTLLPPLAIGAGVVAAVLGANGEAAEEAHWAVVFLMNLTLGVWAVAWLITIRRRDCIYNLRPWPIVLLVAVVASFLLACPLVGAKSLAQVAIEAVLGLG